MNARQVITSLLEDDEFARELIHGTEMGFEPELVVREINRHGVTGVVCHDTTLFDTDTGEHRDTWVIWWTVPDGPEPYVDRAEKAEKIVYAAFNKIYPHIRKFEATSMGDSFGRFFDPGMPTFTDEYVGEAGPEDFARELIDTVKEHPIYGYVLKSTTPDTHFPWFNYKWSNSANCCGNFRRYISSATVVKRLSTAKTYSSLTPVPVYGNPAQYGEKALSPYLVLPGTLESEEDFARDLILPPDAFDPSQVKQEVEALGAHDVWLTKYSTFSGGMQDWFLAFSRLRAHPGPDDQLFRDRVTEILKRHKALVLRNSWQYPGKDGRWNNAAYAVNFRIKADRSVYENSEETFARDLIMGHDPNLITLQAYWDGSIPGTGGGNPWDRPVLPGPAILNDKIASRVRRRDDGMFAVEFPMRDGRLMRVMCPPDTLVKVQRGNDPRSSDVVSVPSFVPPRNPYAPLDSTKPGYVVEIPVDQFNRI